MRAHVADVAGVRRLSLVLIGFIAAALLIVFMGLIQQTPEPSADWVQYTPEPLLVGVWSPELQAVVRRVDGEDVPLVAGVAVDLSFDRCMPDFAADGTKLVVESSRTWVVEYGDRTFERGQETFPEQPRTVPFTGGCDTYSIDVLLWPAAVNFAATQDDATIIIRFSLRPVDGRPSDYVPVVVETEPFRVTQASGVVDLVTINQE